MKVESHDGLHLTYFEKEAGTFPNPPKGRGGWNYRRPIVFIDRS
jgi:hypothetical protein